MPELAGHSATRTGIQSIFIANVMSHGAINENIARWAMKYNSSYGKTSEV